MFIFQHGEEVLPGGARDIIGNVFFQTHFRSGSSLYMQNRTFRSASSASVRVNIWPRETRYPSPCTARRTCRLTRPIGRPDPDRFPYRRGSAADYQPERLSLHSYRPDFRSFQMPQHDEHYPQRSPVRRDFPHFLTKPGAKRLKPVSAG